MGFRLYIGSSYGKDGLQRRVFKDHGSQSHRNLESTRGKYLYDLMAQSGTTWNFVGLVVFKDEQPKQLVLIAEAIMCSLFSSFGLEAYQNLRLPGLPSVDLDICVNRSDPLAIEGHVWTNQIAQDQHRTLANALAGGPQNVTMLQDKNLAIKEYFFNIFDINFTVPKRLGEDWGLASSPFVEVTFDISPKRHQFPFAILCEERDDGCRLGISLSKVIGGVRKQWWLERRTMRGVREANSLFDWLNEDIKDPRTYQWGWDRLAFFGPRAKVRSREIDARWQQRVDAAEPMLRALVASRARQNYQSARPKVRANISHGTKRKIEEVEEDEEEEIEEEVEEEPEPQFSAQEIWVDQVRMTRKYLKDNHRQMRAQGVNMPYFETYRTFLL